MIANITDFDSLKQVLDVGAALLKASDLAVKIETSRMVHTKRCIGNFGKNK